MGIVPGCTGDSRADIARRPVLCPRSTGEEVPVTVSINPDLIAFAVKANKPGFIRGLEGLPVVHISSFENRLLPVFVTYSQYSSQIINALNTLCVKIIRSKEITATEKDFLIIHKVRFDPQKARNLGITAGPAYKQLAAGRPVEINGQVFTPAMVASERDNRSTSRDWRTIHEVNC